MPSRDDPTSKISIDKIGSNQDLYDNFDLSQNQINTVMVYKEGAAYKSLTVSKMFTQKIFIAILSFIFSTTRLKTNLDRSELELFY